MARKKSDIDYVEAFNKDAGGWRAYLVAIGTKNVTMLEPATLDMKIISIKKYKEMHPRSYLTAESLISRIQNKMEAFNRLGLSYPEVRISNFIDRVRKCVK